MDVLDSRLKDEERAIELIATSQVHLGLQVWGEGQAHGAPARAARAGVRARLVSVGSDRAIC